MTSFRNVLTLLSIFATLLYTAHAHSFLLDPRPYVRGAPPDGCVGTECRGCQALYRRDRFMNNTASRPEKTWQRGQRVNIRWAKNNHVGGFVRLAFVPVDQMMDVTVHDRLAFYYGCWEQGHHSCYKNNLDCAADMTQTALQREIEIPSYLPDGIYAFSFLWYGGVNFRRKGSEFADYPSCSFVRIQGGNAMSESFQPFFAAGPRRGFKFRRNCITYTTVPRKCTKPQPGCKGLPVFRDVPEPFKNNQKPELILSSFYTQPESLQPTSTPAPTMTPTPTLSPSAMPTRNTATATNTPYGVPSSSPSAVDNGICTSYICCLSKCGKCGGKGCRARPGGSRNCCWWRIRKNGRKCGQYPPPCSL